MKREVTLRILKKIISSFELNKIKYIVIAGFGLDGKRSFLTRPHQDLDILCLKKDLKKIEKILKKLNYSGEKHNNLYKVYGGDGGKIDLGMLEIEGDYVVSYGRIAITKFPKELFLNPQIGKINNLEFNIAPNEILKTWGKHSKKGDDANYSKSLKTDEKLMRKIKRVLRETSKK